MSYEADLLTRITGGGAVICARSKPCEIGEKAAPNIHTRHTTPQDALSVAYSHHGCNVYFAPATFSGAERKATHAVSAKAFWIDVDVRDDKGFSTFEEALSGITAFVSSCGLPKPLLLHSGGGYHIYWCLSAPVSVGVWKVIAADLHKLVLERGGKMSSDTARIKDIASLMRIPLSYNATRGATGSVVWDTVDLVDITAFRTALKVALGTVIPVRTASAASTPAFGLGARPAHLGGISQPTQPAVSAAPTPQFGLGARPAHLGGGALPAQAAQVNVSAAPSFGLGARPAHLGGSAQPTPPAVSVPPPITTVLPPPPPMVGGNKKLMAATTDSVAKPSYAQLLCNCALLKRMAEEPNRVSEPAWKFAVNILLQTTEGAEAVHEFSAGYDGYSIDETDAKIAQVVVDRPVFCDTIRSVSEFGYVCDACPNKNAHASPVRNATKVNVLRRLPNECALDNIKRTAEHRDVLAKLEVTQSPASDANAANYWGIVPLHPHTKDPDPTIKLPIPPKGYIFGYINLGKSGVFPADAPEPIIEDLIYINKHVDVLDPNTSHKVETLWGFAVITTLGHTFEFQLAAKDLVSVRDLRCALATLGVKYNAGDDLCDYIFAAIDQYAHTKHPVVYKVSSYGWYNIGGETHFITPNGSIAANATHQVAQEVEDAPSFLTDSNLEPQSASLSEWCDDYRTLFGDSPLVGWLTLASLASPLFYVTQDDGENMKAFGVVLSGGTGTGKSLISACVQSAWMRPRYISGNSSQSAIPKEAANMRHLPLVIDDFTVSRKETDKLKDLFLFITTGQERSKSTTGGGSLAQKARWANLSVITTNVKVGEWLAEEDVQGGSLARLLEIAVGTVERNQDLEACAHAKARMLKSGGTLGEVFIKRVLEVGIPTVVRRVQQAIAGVTKTMREHGKSQGALNAMRMRLRMVALTVTVNSLMQDVLPFDTDQAINWAVQSLINGEWSHGTLTDGFVGDATVKTMLRRLKGIIDEEGSAVYKMLAGHDTKEPLPEEWVGAVEKDSLLSCGGVPVSDVVSWIRGDNSTLRTGERVCRVIAVVDFKAQLQGYWIYASTLQNTRKLSVRTRVSDVVDALGSVDETGMPRVVSVKVDSSITGGLKVSTQAVWVSIDELDKLLHGM